MNRRELFKIQKIICVSSLLIGHSLPFTSEIFASTPQFNIIETGKDDELTDKKIKSINTNTKNIILNSNKNGINSSKIKKEEVNINEPKSKQSREPAKNQSIEADERTVEKQKKESVYIKNSQEKILKEPAKDQIIKVNKNKVVKQKIYDKNQINKSDKRSIAINSKGFINIRGPRISIKLKDANVKEVLNAIANIGGYSYIFINNEIDSKSNGRRRSNQNDKKDIRRVSLSLKNEPYEIALNSVLLASGLQGKKEDNMIFIGEDILARSFKPKISKIYQMNQASAASAADYLSSLGALMNKVDTRTAVSTNLLNKSGVTRVSSIGTDVKPYGTIEGPLKGLIGTTDGRLQTITLIGSNKIVSLAERYLKQIDKRQPQVALKVKIVDISLTEDQTSDTYMAYRKDRVDITSDPGTTGVTIMGGSTVAMTAAGMTNIFPNQEFFGWLQSKVSTGDAKIWASPTMILTENNESLSGGAIVSRAESGALSSGTIGRPFANESFVTVGTRVITKWSVTTSEGSEPVCEGTLGTAGLTFGAKVHKIDSNGYITFSVSPALSAITSIEEVKNCGNQSILSVRSLDTGTIRVKDGQTILLTGVLKEDDIKAISKWPIIGDIPLIGRLFKDKTSSKLKSELVIMVTPTILNEDEPISSYNGINYK